MFGTSYLDKWPEYRLTCLPSAKLVAIRSHRSLPTMPTCPPTYFHLTRRDEVSSSSRIQRSLLRTLPFTFVSQPLRFQPATHFVMPFMTYEESVYTSTCESSATWAKPSAAA